MYFTSFEDRKGGRKTHDTGKRVVSLCLSEKKGLKKSQKCNYLAVCCTDRQSHRMTTTGAARISSFEKLGVGLTSKRSDCSLRLFTPLYRWEAWEYVVTLVL